jgi:hypothetical protein
VLNKWAYALVAESKSPRSTALKDKSRRAAVTREAGAFNAALFSIMLRASLKFPKYDWIVAFCHQASGLDPDRLLLTSFWDKDALREMRSQIRDPDILKEYGDEKLESIM